MTSNGRHFRIAKRDVGKPFADSYISSYFDLGFGKVEFVGQIEDIVRLNYDSIKVVLLKGKWWNNNVQENRASTTYVDDECGLLRIQARNFMPDNRPYHEPFVFPEDANQVFVVEDRLNPQWLLVVDTDVRKIRPRIPRNNEEGGTVEDVPTGVEAESEPELDVGTESDEESHDETSDEVQSDHDEGIITYRQRHISTFSQPLNIEQESESEEEETFSDDENPPDIEDFPTLEG